MAQKKKILYLITRGDWGGAQRYVFDLAANLGQEFEVFVAVGEPKNKKDLQNKLSKKEQVSVIQLQHLMRNISPWKDIQAIFELVRLYKKIKPDIIHLNSSKAGVVGSLARIFTLNFKSKIVYTVHGWVFNESLSWWRKKIYRILEKLTAHWKNKLIILSQQDEETAKKLGIKAKKIALIPLGINSLKNLLSKEGARIQLLKHTSKNIPLDKTWIGTIAGLYKNKGLDILIKSISHQKELQDHHFIIIGEGPEKDNLHALIKERGLKNIHFLNFIDDAVELLPAFDLFVLPSRKEGLPYTLLEAMAAKIPFIATRVGGIPSIVADDQKQSIIAPNDPEALGSAIANFFQNKKNIPRFATSATGSSQKLTLTKMVSETEKLYLSMIQN